MGPTSMKLSPASIVVIAVALSAIAIALPVSEESWYAEDDLLQRLHTDTEATPLLTLTQYADSSKAAEAKSNQEKKAAAAAAKVEKKYADEEKKFGAKAK